MKTDLLLVPMGATYRDMRAGAVAAEAAGFDGIWTWDHLRPDSMTRGSAPPECWTVLTAIAEAVPRITVGPLVLNVANRHPGILANMAATLQQVSGGRLILGLGAGGSNATPYANEQRAIGRPVPSDRVRAAQVAEALQVVQRLWHGDSSPFTGEHFSLNRPAGFLPAEPPPPLIVGGFGARMAAIAGRYADGFNTQAGHPALQKLIETAKRERSAAGRGSQPFEVSVFAGLSERWLRPGPERQRMIAAGVGRIILLIEPPFDAAQIREAGRLLRGHGRS